MRRVRAEDQLQRTVVRHYQRRGAPGVFAFSVPNGGYRRAVEAAIMRGTGVVAGIPDLIFIKSGRVYALELRAPGGRLSPNQVITLDAMADAGAATCVAEGLDAALGWLEAVGLLRGSSGATRPGRERLPNRRVGETFELEVAGLRYTATVGRFPDGRIGEIFLTNHKSNSAADTNARDSAIVCSIALQHGADPETIRRALCRDAQGRASGPLGAALDRIAEHDKSRR